MRGRLTFVLVRDNMRAMVVVISHAFPALSVLLLLAAYATAMATTADAPPDDAISYSLYLVNLGLIASPMRRIMTEQGISGRLEWFLLYLIVTFAAAIALHEGVEKPFMRMR